MPSAPLIACPECDLLQREIAALAGETAACRRCGLELYRSSGDDGLDRALAFTLAAVVLLLIANSLPIASLDLRGQHSETTLLGAVHALYEQDMQAVAVLVFITTLFAPAIELAAMCYMLLPLRLGYVPPRLSLAFRLAPAAHAWGLVDVFMLGVLVALIKLGKLATVVPGVALWSFGGLILLLTAIGAAYDPRAIWRCAEANRDSLANGGQAGSATRFRTVVAADARAKP
jgi:paraquat-inducible protein A